MTNLILNHPNYINQRAWVRYLIHLSIEFPKCKEKLIYLNPSFEYYTSLNKILVTRLKNYIRINNILTV